MIQLGTKGGLYAFAAISFFFAMSGIADHITRVYS